MRNTFLKFILLKIIELEPLCISLWTVSFWSLFIYLAKGNQTSPCPILFPICLLRVLFLNVSSHCRAVCGIGLREWTVSALILDTFGSFVCLFLRGWGIERKRNKILALVCFLLWWMFFINTKKDCDEFKFDWIYKSTSLLFVLFCHENSPLKCYCRPDMPLS